MCNKTKKIIEDIQKYVVDSCDQRHYIGFSEERIIHDIIYGLGLALDPEEYSYQDGYERFKEFLIKFLKESMK